MARTETNVVYRGRVNDFPAVEPHDEVARGLGVRFDPLR